MIGDGNQGRSREAQKNLGGTVGQCSCPWLLEQTSVGNTTGPICHHTAPNLIPTDSFQGLWQ